MSHDNGTEISTASRSEEDTTSGEAHVTGERGLAQLLGVVDRLQVEIKEANMISRERERIIDRLHEENQRLKGDALERMMDPVFRDLMRLSDDMQKMASLHTAKGEPAPDWIREILSYHDTVMDILCRQGVEPISAVEGAAFDPKTQRATGSVPTDRAEHDRTLARVIRRGFASPTRVLRPLEAEVYRFVASEPVRAPTAEEAAGDTSAVAAVPSLP